MKRCLTCLMTLWVISTGVQLTALYSDEYPIGAYSNFRNSYSNANVFNNALAVKAHEAGFNAVKCTAVYNADDNSVQNMLNVLNQNQLDAIFEDLIFYPGSTPNNEKYGYTALSAGVFMRFEAEYSSAAAVNPNDDVDDEYFYMSKGRVGSNHYNISYSNKYSWQVSDSIGYAYRDLLYRWPRDGIYNRVGQEFRFLGNLTTGYNVMENNNLYVKFIFAVDTSAIANLPDTTSLAKFTFPTYEGMTTTYSTSTNVYFYLNLANQPMSAFNLTKADYFQLPILDIITGRRELTFIFPLKSSNSQVSTLVSQEVVKANGWYWQLQNLNPWMYWYGHGSLNLDCIDYYDDIFMTNKLKSKGLQTHMY